MIAGVCAGIANRLDLDPLVVRIVFVAAAAAGGAGLRPLRARVARDAGRRRRPAPPTAHARRSRGGRGSVEVALGVALLLLAVLLALRALDVWFSDALVWPLVLVAGGGALLWRQSADEARGPAPRDAPTPDAPEDLRAIGRGAAVVSRVGLGIALVVAAGLVFLQATDSLSAARDVVLAVVVVVVVLAVIFAPWILRLVRSLSAERAERIRSQERAEMAAHLHDSVLQTLALMQKRSSDPREVAGLARRQERELRAWLSGRLQRRRVGSHARRARAGRRRGRGEQRRAGRGRRRGRLRSRPGRRGGRRRRPRGDAERREVRRRLDRRRVRRAGQRPQARVRARPRPGLRPGCDPGRPARRARVDHRPHGAQRRARRDPQHARRRAPRSSWSSRGDS